MIINIEFFFSFANFNIIVRAVVVRCAVAFARSRTLTQLWLPPQCARRNDQKTTNALVVGPEIRVEIGYGLSERAGLEKERRGGSISFHEPRAPRQRTQWQKQ